MFDCTCIIRLCHFFNLFFSFFFQQDIETSVADSFVPTVTAISTSPGLRWMVQPVQTVITSGSPSSGRAKSKTHGGSQSSSTAAASKAKPSNRKGLKDKVCRRARWGGGEGNEMSL